MKTYIELYKDEFKSQRYLLNPVFAAVLWGAALIGIVALYVMASLHVQQASAKLQRLENQLVEQQKVVTALTDTLSQRKPDAALLRNIDALTQTLRWQQKLVNELELREQDKYQGFAELMLDLAKHNEQGLWLTQIRLFDDSATLKGATTDSAAVPRWVEKLRNTQYFQGRSFASASIIRTDSDVLNFTIQTEATSPASDSQVLPSPLNPARTAITEGE